MSTEEPRSGWTISDSEWNGFVERCERQARRGVYLIPLLMIVPVLVCAVAFLSLDAWNRSTGGSGWIGPLGRLFWVAIVPIDTVLAIRNVRSLRRFARAVARVRVECGCVCPTCGDACAPRNADGFAPRCRHGVSRDAQPALIECWQAIARRDIYAVGRLNASLPASDAPRGIRARIQRVVLRAVSTAADTERPFRQRYRAGLVSSLAFIPVILMMTGMPMLMGGPFLPMMTIPFAAGLFAAAPFFAMSGATRPTTQERCRACRQLLARVRPSRCSECGADLSRPAAIESIAHAKQWKFLGVGLAIVMLSFVGSIVVSLGLGVSMLPTPVLLAVAPYSDSSIALSELETRTLSPEDRSRLAQMLISRAAPGTNFGIGTGRRSYRSSNLVLPAVAAGVLPASSINDALRATVALRPANFRHLRSMTPCAPWSHSTARSSKHRRALISCSHHTSETISSIAQATRGWSSSARRSTVQNPLAPRRIRSTVGRSTRFGEVVSNARVIQPSFVCPVRRAHAPHGGG